MRTIHIIWVYATCERIITVDCTNTKSISSLDKPSVAHACHPLNYVSVSQVAHTRTCRAVLTRLQALVGIRGENAFNHYMQTLRSRAWRALRICAHRSNVASQHFLKWSVLFFIYVQ